MKKFRTGVVGATGYTGVELLRIIDQHPALSLSLVAGSKTAGSPLAASWPGLLDMYPDLMVDALDVGLLAERCDIVFLALPHGVSANVAPDLVEAGLIVVDLGADFRLRDHQVYERFYGAHPKPEWLSRSVYGLTEWSRDALIEARLIANPGCYPTATALAAKPLVDAGWGGHALVANCLSGVSGAGRKPSLRSLFSEVGESAQPYGIAGSHRHGPEIEQTLKMTVSFTPHLVPMSRGMVATVIASPARLPTPAELNECYESAYATSPCVSVRADAPSTRDVRGCARAHVHVALDPDRGLITSVCVIDNLLKGAASQAVQNLNVSLGFDEVAGLPMWPQIV
ncbi:MAG: N-acetyl-gamma-glutamyl-phosphate reductase [Myxococcota bacterium]|nr:N-acetyl-gamma-glutamyl-phosphate reductase [Myxococcota bacterium]